MLEKLLAARLAAREQTHSTHRQPNSSNAVVKNLHTTMSELLHLNERYHKLLAESQQRQDQLASARDEIKTLKTELAATQLLEKRLRTQKEHQDELVEAMRSEGEKREQRLQDAENQVAQLSRELALSTEQVSRLKDQLGAEARRNETADRRVEDAYARGLNQGEVRQKTQHAFAMRRVEVETQNATAAAYEHGRNQRVAEQQISLLREQAQQRLLLHYNEQERLRRASLQRQIARQNKEFGIEHRKRMSVTERLKAAHYKSRNLVGELEASQAAHAIDLERAEEAELALDATCAQCTQFAAMAGRSAAHAAASTSRTNQQQKNEAVGDVNTELLRLRAQLDANRARIGSISASLGERSHR